MQKTRVYKRCLSLLAAALILAMPLVSLADEYLVVKGGLLNLRAEASQSSNVLAQYPTGTWMKVLEAGDTWTKVSVAGKEGYVMSKYLSNGSNATTLYVRTNTGIGLNLRTQPSLEGDIVASFKPGTAVSILSRGNAWHKVQVGDEVGYMASRYLATKATSSGTGSSQTGYPKLGIVNNPVATQVLLLRETASTDARVLGNYRNGTQVQLLGTNGDFYKVTVNGVNGYMMKKFIKVVGTESTNSFPATPFAATLKNPNGGSVVNFRKAAGLNTSIIKAYPVGTEITVLEVGENWCKVEIEGTQGYVSTYFFNVKK